MICIPYFISGHYYAYVQDLSTKKWYDFDDSRVSELERKKVKEAWGGNISVPVTYSTSYYGTTATSQSTKFQSSANAYMLMYRRIKAGIDDNVSLPSDDEVPEYIRDELKKLEEEETAKKKQDEERFNKLVVKIIWDEKEYTITTNRKKTYVEFLTQLWDELNVINSPSLEDWKESHPPGMLAGDDNKRKEESVVSAFVRPSYIPFDRIRLRHYNSHLKVSQDIHDVETKGEYTLQMLQILDYRALSLQCRSLNEMWDVYIQNGVNLVAMIYDPVTDAFMPPKNVRMRRNDPVLSLKESLRHFVDYDISEMRLLKLSALGVSDIRKEELSDDFAELELRCRVYEGTKIYVENKNKYVIDQSPSLSCFIKSINTITVNISTIGKTHFDLKLVVDRRITFEEFRKRIAKDINMEPNTFRIHRHIVKGQELQYAGNETLQMVGVYDGASLALSEGTPLKPGFSSLAIVLFDNKCAGGIQNLTDLALDEAIAKYSSPANADSEVGAGADIEYEDSIVVAESAWSPARKSEVFLLLAYNLF